MKNLLAASVITLIFLSGCDSESPQTGEVVGELDESQEHLYSKEQELIKQAQGIESLLAEDADKKKKAVSDEISGK